MSAALDHVLEHLDGLKRSGAGYIARCPGHEDHRQSLSLAEGDDGRVLLTCHAGCDLPTICAALEMTPADLFEKDGNGSRARAREIVAEYDYTDEAGATLFQVIRFAPKDFRQRRPDGVGGWTWRLADVRRVLYRLPQVIATAEAGGNVFVAEGEKDVHALEQAGAVATCNAGGAGKWKPEYSEFLSGANVVIVADKDGPGRTHAASVAASVGPLAASVRVVEAAEGKDAADHLAARHGLEDFVTVDLGAASEGDGAEVTPAPPLESTTDTGNANRFVRLFGERVRYCDVEGRWYVHDGCRWAHDETLLVAEWMRVALQSIFEDAARAAGESEAKELGKWGTRSLSSGARKAALECVKSDPRIAVHPAEFDQGPYLLNCPNGTLDLQTRELRPHDPADLLRKVTAAPYIPGARSELWERVIAEATGDAEFAAAFQRACGYSATGDTSEEVFFILHGPTQAVKSTVCNAADETLGDYSASVNPETWLERGQVGGTRGDLVELDGVRMAISAEASARTAMATALLKAFTGGDRITVRRIFERDRSMRPTAKVWLHTNQVPKMPDDDDAIWRRAVIFPFEHPPADPDPRIKATLCDVAQSGPAVLAWIVEGVYEWQRRGLAVPDLVKHATQVVRLGMDPLRDFFDECCVFELDVWTSTGDLRAAYDHWRKTYSQARGIGAKEWGLRLSARGLEPSKSRHVRGWLGVRLADVEYVESRLPGTEGDGKR